MFQVRVTQTDAKARLDVKDPFLRLKTQDVAVKISGEEPKLEIHSPAAELSIDSYPSNRARGIKNNIDFDRDNAAKGMQAVQAAIAKFAQDGARLAKIENGGNPLKQLAQEAMTERPLSISIGYVPDPTVRVVTHEAQIQVTSGALNIRFDGGTVDGELDKGTVSATMLQYPEVNFQFVGQNLDVAS